MSEVNYKPTKYQDFISSFEGGMQSGVSPLLLPKNQLAVGVNCSLRGGYVHPRPPLQIKTLNFGGNSALQTLVTTGLFQGAEYYRPDFGTESILASISGHLILFTESSFGGAWNVSDVSINGDLNNALQTQVWMWQSEKWMIVNDGTGALPIFFDGTTSRRSYGQTIVLGTVQSVIPTSPPPLYVTTAVPPLTANESNTTTSQAAASVLVTLSAPYTGPYNVPIIFNGEYYQASAVNFSGGSTTNAQLTNLTDTPGNTIGVGTAIRVQSNLLAVVKTGGTANRPSNAIWDGFITLILTNTNGFSVNQQVKIPYTAQTNSGPVSTTGVFAVTQVTPSLKTVQVELLDIPSTTASISIAANVIITQDNSANYVTLGTVVNSFTAPAVNGGVAITMSQPFTGTNGQLVLIGNAVYTIAAIGAPLASNQLTLINLSDTSTQPYATPLPINSVPELPAGRMGAYGMGRNWFSLPNGISYMAGDIVGSGSGTPAFNYRDSVLKTTENDFLTGGGTFSLPGTGEQITAMIFPPVLDSSLGVGSLQIFTPFTVFANNAPADRTTWTNLTWPIQSETLKGQGAMGQDSTVLVNSDVFFRSDFNICSLVLAKRQFEGNQWGNKPIGNEMQRFLLLDNPALLTYGTGCDFDNRFFESLSPTQSGTGVYHLGIGMLNFDLLSSLRTTLPAAWEGAWTGLNLLKIVTGRINGMNRCFGFGFNLLTNQIELYEMYSEAYAIQNQIFNDNGTVPITWMFETAVLFNKDMHPLTELLQLRDGEIQVSNIQQSATIQVFYRSDFYPCWTLWNTQAVCTDTSAATANATYHTRLGLGEPDSTIPAIDRPMRLGRFFQFRFVITGYCTINGFQVSAVTSAEPVFAPVNQTGTCIAIDCTVTPDLQLYSLESLNPAGTPPPPVFAFFNQSVFFLGNCPDNTTTFSYNGSLPDWITLDVANGRLIGAAGTFGGDTQADANAAAQVALQAFGNAALQAGTLGCFACPTVVYLQLTGHVYGISGYVDGMLNAPGTFTPCSGGPVWNGTFIYSGGFVNGFTPVPNNPCVNGQQTSVSTNPAIFDIQLVQQSCTNNVITWELFISNSNAQNFGRWFKVGGFDPTGLYTYQNGSGDSPIVTQPNLTVVQLS